MALDYIGEIRKVQPTGPYYLLGWSFGGVVAHEIATTFQAQGDKVALLGLMDSFPSRSNSLDDIPDEAEIVKEMLGPETIRTKRMTKNDPFLAKLGKVAHNNRQLARLFVPHEYNGDLLLFTAAAKEDSTSQWLAWKPYVTGQIGVHPILCRHMEMMEVRNVAQIERVLTS